jgi:penicillin-binding protein 1C
VVAQRACALAHELRLPSTCSEIQLRIIVAWSRPQLAGKLAPAPQVAQQLLTRSGQAVRSTLDAGLQRHAQAVLRQQLAALNGRNVNDGAVIVLDNASGEILAYVGNAGGAEVDGVAALRQAGSTLKPFLYELALERKQITAASLMDDTAIDISTGSGMYAPQNYDKGYKGYVSARTSLASSLNVPAVRTLMMTGMERFHERLRDVGLSSLTQPAEYYGYSLALGSAEVSLLELANAYRTLANGGMYSAATLAPKAGGAPRRVLDARALHRRRYPCRPRGAQPDLRLKNELATTFWAAVKTGTSKDMRDNWCVGYSDKYTVGVWVGNFNGQSMWDVSGVSGAAPVWRDVMDYLHRSTGSRAPGRRPAWCGSRSLTSRSWSRRAANGSSPAPRARSLRWCATTIVRRKSCTPAKPASSPSIPTFPTPLSASFPRRGGQGLRWQLDGEPLAQATTDYAWRPTPGRTSWR